MTIATTPSGSRIAWDSFGSPARPAMVLIQGLNAPRMGWHPGFCACLADEGFHVIRFDNRDVGESQQYPRGGYTLEDLADDTAALLDVLNLESAHVTGQSMGGMVAQLLCRRHARRVRSLGLIYTAASGRHYHNREAALALMERPVPTTRDEFAAHYLAGESMCRSTAYAQDLAWRTELASQIWDRSWNPAAGQRQVEALLAAPDRLDVARGIRVPTVIIAGTADRLIHSDASAELHELIPGSALRLFEGMGHELPRPLWGEIAQLLAGNARAASPR